MGTFGKQSGGGRRLAARERLPLPAVVSTLQESITAEVLDLSLTGVRLKGPRLPKVDTFVELKIDKLEAYGTVAWRTEDSCGVAFDVPLSNTELGQLRREVNVAAMRWHSVDERLAARDWHYGAAR